MLAEGIEISRRFGAVELNEVKGIIGGYTTDMLDVFIHEDANALGLCREISRTLAYKATGLRPKDKAHPFNA